MQIFKTFFRLLWKYRMGMVLYFGICVFMTVMVAAQFESSKKEVKYGNERYHITVVDKDRTELSRAIMEYLEEQHRVEKIEYEKELLTDLIYYQELSACVTIPKGFEKTHLEEDPLLVESLSDEGQAAGVFLNMQLRSYLDSVAAFERAGSSLKEAIKSTREAVDFKNFVHVESEKTNGVKNGDNKLYHLFLFLPFPVMTILLSSVLPVILTFQRDGIKERMNLSAVSISSRTVALFAGGAAVSFLIFLGLGAFASFFLPKEVFHGKWIFAMFNLFVFTMVIVMLMIFFVSISFLGIQKSKNIITNIVALGFSFLGGIFVPLSLLGDGVRAVGRFLPTYWYAEALEEISNGTAFSKAAGNFLPELLFGVVCFMAGILIMNRENIRKFFYLGDLVE